MTQIAILLFWIFLPCAVLGVSITALLHFKSKKKIQKLFVKNETTRIAQLEKELTHYKKAYNKLLCKYHELQKDTLDSTISPFKNPSSFDAKGFHQN